jgi:signal transduction histidine kinase/CheY-like chemotaxis protein
VLGVSTLQHTTIVRDRPARRRVGLRWVVGALVLVVVAPLTILGGVGIERSWRRLIANLNRQNLATVRAISVAVDQEVQVTSAALNVLGELHALDAPDLPAFENLAGRLLPNQPAWSAILLTDANGTLIDGVPDKADGDARVGNDGWARTTAARRAATVSNLFQLPRMPGHFVIVGVPVVRDGRVAFMLGARVRSDGFSAILRQRQAPPNGTATLVDASGVVVARTKAEETFVGTPVPQAFTSLLAQTAEGSWQPPVADGPPTYSSFSRSPRTGLIVELGVPTEEIDGPTRRLVWILSGAWLFIIGSGAFLGFLFGGVIVRGMSDASRASLALARGEDIALRESRIAEIDDLATGLRAAAATLQERNRERDHAARLKDEFLMTVSHELRTPLTAIVGWANMLATGQIRDGQRPHAMSAIERNANALHQIVNDLLDVSRIVSGNLRIDFQPLALADVVAAAIDTVRPVVEAKGITIVTAIDEDATVRGDAGRIQQVVWNLLSNAARFTPQGGRLDIAIARVGSDALITVRDSGTGIAPDFLPHVFEPFRQAETRAARAVNGLGLGLAIVRHLVELHGGTVSAENNTPPPGSTFRVRLPLHAATMATVSGGRPSSRLAHVHLLVADRDAQTRELFTTILENAGAHVRAAASADDAQTLLATERPDVLVSDIEILSQDGSALLRRVREMEGAGGNGGRAGRVLTIAVTPPASGHDHEPAIDSGLAWRLARPFEADELVKLVAMAVEQAAT